MEVKDKCFNCEDMKKKIEEMKQRHILNFRTIKQKIISTDELIKMYQKKCQEFDKKTKELAERNASNTVLQSNVDVLKIQLEKSMKLNEPLKKKCANLESERQQGKGEVQRLQDRIKGSESLIQQLKVVVKEKENEEKAVKLEAQLQNHEVEAQKKNLKKNEATITRLKERIVNEKAKKKEKQKQLTSFLSRIATLEKQAQQFKETITSLKEQVHQATKGISDVEQKSSSRAKDDSLSPSPPRRNLRTRRSTALQKQSDDERRSDHGDINKLLNEITSPSRSLSPFPPSPGPFNDDLLDDDEECDDDGSQTHEYNVDDADYNIDVDNDDVDDDDDDDDNDDDDETDVDNHIDDDVIGDNQVDNIPGDDQVDFIDNDEDDYRNINRDESDLNQDDDHRKGDHIANIDKMNLDDTVADHIDHDDQGNDSRNDKICDNRNDDHVEDIDENNRSDDHADGVAKVIGDDDQGNDSRDGDRRCVDRSDDNPGENVDENNLDNDIGDDHGDSVVCDNRNDDHSETIDENNLDNVGGDHVDSVTDGIDHDDHDDHDNIEGNDSLDNIGDDIDDISKNVDHDHDGSHDISDSNHNNIDGVTSADDSTNHQPDNIDDMKHRDTNDDDHNRCKTNDCAIKDGKESIDDNQVLDYDNKETIADNQVIDHDSKETIDDNQVIDHDKTKIKDDKETKDDNQVIDHDNRKTHNKKSPSTIAQKQKVPTRRSPRFKRNFPTEDISTVASKSSKANMHGPQVANTSKKTRTSPTKANEAQSVKHEPVVSPVNKTSAVNSTETTKTSSPEIPSDTLNTNLVNLDENGTSSKEVVPIIKEKGATFAAIEALRTVAFVAASEQDSLALTAKVRCARKRRRSSTEQNAANQEAGQISYNTRSSTRSENANSELSCPVTEAKKPRTEDKIVEANIEVENEDVSFDISDSFNVPCPGSSVISESKSTDHIEQQIRVCLDGIIRTVCDEKSRGSTNDEKSTDVTEFSNCGLKRELNESLEDEITEPKTKSTTEHTLFATTQENKALIYSGEGRHSVKPDLNVEKSIFEPKTTLSATEHTSLTTTIKENNTQIHSNEERSSLQPDEMNEKNTVESKTVLSATEHTSLTGTEENNAQIYSSEAESSVKPNEIKEKGAAFESKTVLSAIHRTSLATTLENKAQIYSSEAESSVKPDEKVEKSTFEPRTILSDSEHTSLLITKENITQIYPSEAGLSVQPDEMNVNSTFKTKTVSNGTEPTSLTTTKENESKISSSEASSNVDPEVLLCVNNLVDTVTKNSDSSMLSKRHERLSVARTAKLKSVSQEDVLPKVSTAQVLSQKSLKRNTINGNKNVMVTKSSKVIESIDSSPKEVTNWPCTILATTTETTEATCEELTIVEESDMSTDQLVLDSVEQALPLSTPVPDEKRDVPSFEEWDSIPPLSPIPASPERCTEIMDSETTMTIEEDTMLDQPDDNNISALTKMELDEPHADDLLNFIQDTARESSVTEPKRNEDSNPLQSQIPEVIQDPLDRSAKVCEKRYVVSLLRKLKTNTISTGEVSRRLLVVTNLRSALPFATALVGLLKNTADSTEHALLKKFADQCRHVSEKCPKDWPPILTAFETRVIDVIHHLSTTPRFKGILMTLLRSLGQALGNLLQSQDHDAALLTICRVSGVVSRLLGDGRYVRVLCYDVIRTRQHPVLCQRMIMSICLVWPEVFWRDDSRDTSYQPFLLTLQTIVMSRSRLHEPALQVFQRLYGWSPVLGGDGNVLEKLARDLVKVLRAPGFVCLVKQKDFGSCMCVKAYEIVKCLELLAVVLGWKWSNNVLVRELVWPVLQEWKTNFLREAKSATNTENTSLNEMGTDSAPDKEIMKDEENQRIPVSDESNLTSNVNSNADTNVPSVTGTHSTAKDGATTIGGDNNQIVNPVCDENSKNMEALIVSILRLVGLLGRVGAREENTQICSLVRVLSSILTGQNKLEGVTFPIELAAAYAAVDMLEANRPVLSHVLTDWTARMEQRMETTCDATLPAHFLLQRKYFKPRPNS